MAVLLKGKEEVLVWSRREHKLPGFTGFWVLFCKEVKRFLKVKIQTIVGPLVANILFLIIFSAALGNRIFSVVGVDFLAFIASGLITMNMLQNAFSNTSSSLSGAKIMNHLGDLLVTPLSSLQIVLAYTLAGALRGLLIGCCSLLVFSFVVDFPFYSIIIMLLSVCLASFIMSTLGFITGMWVEKWEQLSVISNFIIMPLSFLSGTFYVVSNLPPIFYAISLYNPFFHAIDSFRYGLLGVSEVSIVFSLSSLMLLAVVLFAMAWRLLEIGWKLRA